jgi:hypothetical protein
MIVLDTNLLSEVLRPDPSPPVTGWFESESPRELFVTTIAQAEILHGIEILPDERRKAALRENFLPFFEQFAGRVLAVDEASASAFAAIALSRKASLCTRNVKDFARCGIALINPWD